MRCAHYCTRGVSIATTGVLLRNAERHAVGSMSRGNKRVGHVPGAVHLEWFNLLDSATNEFKPAAEIRRILTDHGITPDKNVYTY